MKRWSFLLFDANVIILLFKQEIWDQVVAACDLSVAETIIGEAHFFEDDVSRGAGGPVSGGQSLVRVWCGFGAAPSKLYRCWVLPHKAAFDGRQDPK